MPERPRSAVDVDADHKRTTYYERDVKRRETDLDWDRRPHHHKEDMRVENRVRERFNNSPSYGIDRYRNVIEYYREPNHTSSPVIVYPRAPDPELITQEVSPQQIAIPQREPNVIVLRERDGDRELARPVFYKEDYHYRREGREVGPYKGGRRLRREDYHSDDEDDYYFSRFTTRRSGDSSINDTVGAWLSDLDPSQAQSKTDKSNLSTYSQREDANLANTNINPPKINSSDTNPSKIQGTTDLWLAAYHELIPKTEGYQWLLSRLKKELLMTPAKPSFKDTINNLITQSLVSSLRTRDYTHATVYRAEFEVDWDIMAFLEKQQYTTDLRETIEKIITVTGSYQDSFITTCGQYINQTWPSSGEIIIQLVKELVDSKVSYPTSKSTLRRLAIDNNIF